MSLPTFLGFTLLYSHTTDRTAKDGRRRSTSEKGSHPLLCVRTIPQKVHLPTACSVLSKSEFSASRYERPPVRQYASGALPLSVSLSVHLCIARPRETKFLVARGCRNYRSPHLVAHTHLALQSKGSGVYVCGAPSFAASCSIVQLDRATNAVPYG